MLKLWAISLILEAALAVVLTRRGGFAAFLAFLWYDVATQALGMACSGSGAWYPLIHRWSEAGAVGLLAFVVREATCKDCLHVDRGRLLASCTAVAIAIHLAFADSVPWSIWASGVWQLVALSHSIMGLYVGAISRVPDFTAQGPANVAPTSFRLRSPFYRQATLGGCPVPCLTTGSLHGPPGTTILLAFWLLADAAPQYPVGMSVLWLNSAVWAAWMVAAFRQEFASPS